jgi:hypothetical protein
VSQDGGIAKPFRASLEALEAEGGAPELSGYVNAITGPRPVTAEGGSSGRRAGDGDAGDKTVGSGYITADERDLDRSSELKHFF